MKNHYYTIKTENDNGVISSGGRYSTLEEAIDHAMKGPSFEGPGNKMEINHWKVIASVMVKGWLRDSKEYIQRDATTDDVGRDCIRKVLNGLLAQFEKVEKVLVETEVRSV